MKLYLPAIQTLLTGGLLSISQLGSAQAIYPSTIIQNGQLEVMLYLPDEEDGYYRAKRFDWSGIIGSLVYKGHQYFDPWLDYHDPLVHEAISGPVEAFTPIGFETAAAGEYFLIIGVGILKKPDQDAYQFARDYELINPGKWTVEAEKDKITFQQTLQDQNGWAYQYVKRVVLQEDQPVLLLEHELKNTGTQALETTVYNHNFFVIDQEVTGPNIVSSYPFLLEAEGRGFGELIQVDGHRLAFDRQLQPGESVYCSDLKGYGSNATDHNITIKNLKSGAGVQITADQPLDKLSYWACATTACPEPYIKIKTEPGETFRWMIKYSFFEN